MSATVTAEMIVVPGDPDGLVYLAKGAPVPGHVTKEKLKELEEFGLIEIEKPTRSRAASKKSEDDAKTGTDAKGSDESTGGDGSDESDSK